MGDPYIRGMAGVEYGGGIVPLFGVTIGITKKMSSARCPISNHHN